MTAMLAHGIAANYILRRFYFYAPHVHFSLSLTPSHSVTTTNTGKHRT